MPLGLSLVGAPLAAILMIALVLCWWLGAASVGFLIGRRLLRLRGRDGSLTRAALTGGALLGAIVGIPVVGGIVWCWPAPPARGRCCWRFSKANSARRERPKPPWG